MWKRKELVKAAKSQVKANYGRCISVAFILLVLIGGITFPRISQAEAVLEEPHYRDTTNTQIVNEVAQNIFSQNNNFLTSATGVVNAGTSGALSSLINNATASGSLAFGILNAFNQLLFQDSIVPGIIIAIGTGITFLYFVFGKNILQVGKYRFFLENRFYQKTQVSRILYIYEIGHTRRVARVMFLRDVYNVLWFFTIVGGFIKLYSYRMVPFIVAENPHLSAREAIDMSRRMMHGQKWRCFLLDMSFIGWEILSYLTFSIARVLYVDPYYTATNAELYMHLRDRILEEDKELDSVFTDRLLVPLYVMDDEYPLSEFHLQPLMSRSWIRTDYHRVYHFEEIVFLFLAFAFVGYAWEVFYYLVKDGMFINRGTLYGPWLPIYGCGGVGALLILKRFVDKPVRLFFLAIVVCGTLEYTTAWFLETFLQTKWWDYTGYFLNLHGRICLEGLLVFGVGCMAGIYILAPILSMKFDKLPKMPRRIVLAIISCAFVADAIYSAFSPNMAAGTVM